MMHVTRLANPRPRIDLVQRMWVEKGNLDDWRLLEGLHYKQSGVLPAGSHHYKLTLEGETIGVLVMASPKMLLKERHQVFPNIKPGHDTRFTNQYRVKWINANLTLVARVVVDTMYRGVGLAYRFTNLASRMDNKQFVEIQSSMSKYNLFAHKAGFQFVKPSRSNKYETGIKFFRSTFESNPADTEALIGELLDMTPELRAATEAKIRAFYLSNSAMENTGKCRDGVGEARVARMPIRDVLTNTQQMVLASPLYGIYRNPDAGRNIPKRLPLTAFDWQTPTAPLDLGRIPQ